MANPERRAEATTGGLESLDPRPTLQPGSIQSILFLVLLSLLCTSLPSPSYSAALPNCQSVNQDFLTVVLGVEHLRIIRGSKSDNDAAGPWMINLLRIDLKQAELRIAHALDEGVGLETGSSIAARYGALAAVNAGFFRTTGTYRGEPSGVLLLDGKLISEPIDGRAAFGLIKRGDETGIIFGHLKFSGSVETRGSRHTIDGLNRPRGGNELIVYSPEFHRTTLTTRDGIEVIVRRNKAIRIRDAEGSSAIPPDGFVISSSGSARDWIIANLHLGSPVRVVTKLLPVERETAVLWHRASFIVGGGPQLIRDGKVAISFEDEKIAAKLVSDRHPRTAIARLKDGRILFATVDGRQPGVSVGMSLPELASLLLEFGASEAINLDGGGSTTMVVNGKLVNSPSDQAGERPVSDAILVLPKRLQPKRRIE